MAISGSGEKNLAKEITHFDKVVSCLQYQLQLNPSYEQWFQAPQQYQEIIQSALLQLDLSEGLVLLLNERAEIVYINSFASEILGLEYTKLFGRCWMTEFVPVIERTEMMMIFEQIMRGYEHPFDEYISGIQPKGGGQELYKWQNVVLRKADKSTLGCFSYGIDSKVGEHLETFALDDLSDLKGYKRE